jgi:predicted amidohydrolase YtcJ
VIEESAVTIVGNPILSRVNARIDAMAIERGQALYSSFGYTTAEEARAYPSVSAALAQAARDGRFRIDVISYPDIAANAAGMESEFWRQDRQYSHRYRIGGAKISLDGSPQSKTAWLTHPYHIVPPHTEAGYRGYPAMSDEQALRYFTLAASRGWQIICHANGDAAIDQCLNSIEAAQQRHPNPDHRSVIIHAQMMRADQVTRMRQLGALPSFFAAHTFYWGDYHRESTLGSPRAERISPTRDALNAGLTLTTHHDAPVIMPNAMRIVDATVNRTTRSGFTLGPQQRLTPFEALKAVTIWAAIQHFEEASKGTLSRGKRADLVILSANPVRIAPAQIRGIRVVATIKDGQLIYCAPEQSRAAICRR